MTHPIEYHEYHSRAIIEKVEKRSQLVRAWKNIHNEVQEEKADLGWYVIFRDSPVAIHFGDQEPDLFPGQEVVVIIRTIPAPRSAEADDGSPTPPA